MTVMNGLYKTGPASNIDDAWAAVDSFPLAPDDPRYVNCSRVRGVDAVGKIERMLKRHQRSGRDLHLLFTGYRGNGKTTELYQLISKVESDFEVIYFDAARELDINNLKLTDMLLAIARQIIKSMEEGGFGLPKPLLEEIGNWFLERILERTGSIDDRFGVKSELGISGWTSAITEKILSSMRMGTRDREILRQRMERNTGGLIEKVNDLLTSARERVKAGGKKDMIFIIDSLDRILVEQGKEVFIAKGNLLKELNGNFVYVISISLLYDEQAAFLPFNEKLTLPMIPVFKRGLDHEPDEAGIDHLKKIISVRVATTEVFTNPEETVRELILASGGHLRDMMKMVSDACNETDDKITPIHATTAINMLVMNYERVVRDEEYAHLVKVYRTQSPPNNAVNQRLIYSNVILVYEEPGGVDWKDVHPAVVRNGKFRRRLSDAP